MRFNAVGAMGMAVQLSALAVLERVVGRHYLWATAAAIELTLLHNFTWHVHYTWRDRSGLAVGAQLVRFHLSSGVVSMAGNLGLMRLLVHGAGMPMVAANGCAILCCSLVNFGLGNWWAFAGAGCGEDRARGHGKFGGNGEAQRRSADVSRVGG
jgi:putative flippase GtrA